ncbi:MAG: hypothetical protein HQM11_09460 [SAR324 cluster bacterium]|nr:hypothetical protein [SAR324 cluster bacterium]
MLNAYLNLPKNMYRGKRNLIQLLASLTGLVLLAVGCASSRENYAYPTEIEIKVNETCTRIYDPANRGIIAVSRHTRVIKFVVVSEGILTFFADGKSYVLPLQTGLDDGEEYYCGSNKKSTTPCLSTNDWDTHCKRSRPIRPDKFKY